VWEEAASLDGERLASTTLARTIVIEFGNGGSVFEAIAPEGYVGGGKWKLLRDLGAHFTI